MPVYKVFIGIIDKIFVVEAEDEPEAASKAASLISDEDREKLAGQEVYMGFQKVETSDLD